MKIVILMLLEGCCGYGNEPSGSIKDGDFFEYLNNY
jgi:hypothetical protein